MTSYPGFSKMYWCGREGDYNCIVMELLGKNLEELLKHNVKRFSLKTVALLSE